MNTGKWVWQKRLDGRWWRRTDGETFGAVCAGMTDETPLYEGKPIDERCQECQYSEYHTERVHQQRIKAEENRRAPLGSPSRTCKTCRFSCDLDEEQPCDGADELVECRRHAPARGAGQHDIPFPVTRAVDWCGEHLPKEES